MSILYAKNCIILLQLHAWFIFVNLSKIRGICTDVVLEPTAKVLMASEADSFGHFGNLQFCISQQIGRFFSAEVVQKRGIIAAAVLFNQPFSLGYGITEIPCQLFERNAIDV